MEFSFAAVSQWAQRRFDLQNENSRRIVTRALTLFAGGLMALSAYCLRPGAPTWISLFAGGWLMVAGTVFLGAALTIHRWSGVPRPGAIHPPLTPAQPRAAPLLLGALGMALLAEVNAGFFRLPALEGLSQHVQFPLLVASILLIVWGLSGRSAGRARIPLSLRRADWHWIALAAVVGLGFGLRLWRLGSAVHFFVDEIHFSTGVMTLMPSVTRVRLLAPFSGITAFPWLYPYMQWGAVSLLGRDLGGLRFVSAALGALTVPAVYLLGRTLFDDRKLALLAALLLATFPPHLHYSRLALNNVADPLFGTLALAFILRGLKHNRRRDYALGGAALGLTQYFYEGGRMLFPLLLIAVLGLTHVLWRGYLRHRRRGLVVAALAAGLVGLPIYTTLFALRAPLLPRVETVAVGGSYWHKVNQEGVPQTLGQHLARPLLMYVHMPELALFYGGQQPLVLDYLVPLFLLGVGFLVWQPSIAAVAALGWLLLTSAGNMLLTESAISARYVVAFPAIALLLAVAVRCIPPLIWPQRAARWVIVGLGVAVAACQTTYYFGPHLETYNTQQLRTTYDSQDALFRSAGMAYGTQVHIFTAVAPPKEFLTGLMTYLADGITVEPVPPLLLTPNYLANLSPAVDHAFFIEPLDGYTLTLLLAHFTLEGPYFSPFGIPPDKELVLFVARAQAAGG